MPPQRAAGDGLPCVASNKHGRIRARHVLGRHVEAELGRRERQENLVELADELGAPRPAADFRRTP
jgi:hypothetical protein